MRFICSDESVNSHGFWVLTAGINTERFEKNPVMLWNHSRSYGNKNDVLPIGYWKDIKVENGQLTAEPVFDAKDEFAQQIASKVEQGVVRACSIGITVLATSSEKEYIKPGQLCETVTACELREISLCDIPANGNAVAVALYDADDKLISLSDVNIDHLPIRNLNQKQNNMNEILETLGLSKDSGKELVLAEIAKLRNKIAQLEKEKQEAADVALRDLINEAIRQRKTTEDKRELYMGIGRTGGVDVLRSVLADLAAPMAPTSIINQSASAVPGDKAFADFAAAELESMRDNDPQRYADLFAAHYGFKPELI